jgi:hypothetical protein
MGVLIELGVANPVPPLVALGFREAVTPAVSNQLTPSRGGAQAGVTPRVALSEADQQTPDERGRHLPQRRRHCQAGGQSVAGAAGGMAAGTSPLLLRGHHGQDPRAREAAGVL